MKIINKDGEIIEGQPLTEDEVEILTELTTGGALCLASGSYIMSRDAGKIAHYLIATFEMKRRIQPVAEDDADVQPEPIQPIDVLA
jgi:hypothetical protein